MDWKPVHGFYVGVSSELRQDTRIDFGRDAVIGSLHTIKDASVSAGCS